MITIKNSKGDICDYIIPYNVDINAEVKNLKKIIEEIQQKIIDITGIPKNILNS